MTVTLDGAANDGEAAESDDADVENVTGGAGDDSLSGSAVANVLIGASGADALSGGGGSDALAGVEGDDTLDGGTGADSISGGADTDLVDYGSRAAAVTVTLDGAADDGEVAESDNAKACLGTSKPKKVRRAITIRSPRTKRMAAGEKGARRVSAAKPPARAAAA